MSAAVLDDGLVYEILSVVAEIPEGRVASYGQIAAQLAVPVGTVKSRLFNARRMLCELLEKGVET